MQYLASARGHVRGTAVTIAALLASILAAAPALAEETGNAARPSAPAETDAASKPVDATTSATAVGVTPTKPQPSALDTPVAQPKFPALPQEDPKTEGLIPGILFGPKLSIISLPTPGLGVEVRAHRLFGASFDYGFIPDVTISSVTLGMTTWKVGAKVYPMRGAFFLGANLGSYTFTAKSTVTDSNGQTASAKLDISATFIAPEIGWRWGATGGFFTGVDLGWQFPLNYKSTLNVPTSASAGTIKDIRDKADQYVKSGLPALGMLELGWLF
jgi:hypothetical protein